MGQNRVKPQTLNEKLKLYVKEGKDPSEKMKNYHVYCMAGLQLMSIDEALMVRENIIQKNLAIKKSYYHFKSKKEQSHWNHFYVKSIQIQ